MDGVVNKNDKYQIAILIIVIVFILLFVFALVFKKVDIGNKNKNTIGVVINDGDLAINYIDGNEVVVKDSKEHSYSVTLTNVGSTKIYYSMYFTDLSRNDMDITIEDYDGNKIASFEEKLDSTKLINLQVINASETKRYVVKINGDGSTFKAKLKVENDSLTSDSFSDVLLSSYSVSMPQTRVGSEVSRINEGLLSTNDNHGKTYYFRGDINYNYVKLGNLLFRIVRINGNGSVRLVLNDVLETQYPYNTNAASEKVTVNALASLSNASITAKLNEWFEKNLVDYKKYIVNSDFCTDINFNLLINNINYSNGYGRIFVDNAPDLYCSGSIYTGKVGLLSADEISLAGAYRNVGNDKYYLYNKNIKTPYVTSSSYSMNGEDIHMINVLANGGFGDSVLTSAEVGIRPVISIGDNAKIKGSGTIDDPFVIVA